MALWGAASMAPFDLSIQLEGIGQTGASGSSGGAMTVEDVIMRAKDMLGINPDDCPENIDKALIGILGMVQAEAMNMHPWFLMNTDGTVSTLVYPTELGDTLLLDRVYMMNLIYLVAAQWLLKDAADVNNLKLSMAYQELGNKGW